MSDGAAFARQALAQGDTGSALANVVSTWGSAPRPVEGHLLPRAGGHFAGSISGGYVEEDIEYEGSRGLRHAFFGSAL